MGMTLFRHSLRMVFGNLADALKVSIGPMLIGFAAIYLMGNQYGNVNITLEEMQSGAEIPPGFLMGFFLMVVLVIVLFSWVALAWHRYVLLEEYPGLLPKFHAGLILPYFGKSLLVGVVIVLVMILPAALIGVVFTVLGPAAAPLFPLVSYVVLILLGTFLWLRMAMVLPAVSVEKPMGISQSLKVTKPLSGAIFNAGILLTLLSAIPAVLIALIFRESIVAQVLNMISSWVSAMVSVAMLTTLYGIVIEGRDLS